MIYVKENSEYVVYGPVQDELGFSPDAELLRTKSETEARKFVEQHEGEVIER